MFDGMLRALGVPMLSDRNGSSRDPARPTSIGRRGGGTDIFVGGGGDDLIPDSAMSDYVKTYDRQTGRAAQYVPNNRIGQVVNIIRDANRDGGPVNVIGHSYGGPDAYNAVAIANRQGLHVDNLITLDPVGGPTNRVLGMASPERWMNVHTTPDRPDLSDWLTTLAPLAHKPSALPIAQADQNIELRLNHRDVEGMMGQSRARAVLDGSRQRPPDRAEAFYRPATAQALHDNLPMMDWIRRRQAQATAAK